MKYYKHIDGLRALAVIAVLLVHLDFATFSGGFVGVDVFFVISGFLITNIIIKELETTNSFSFVNFYTRRIRRIMPALIFTLSLSFILGIWLLNLAKFQVFGGSLATAIVSFSNIFFYNQAGYFDIFSQSSPLLHTWSLGVEEQFYIFWPVLLLLCYKASRKLLLPLLVCIFICSLGWSIHQQNVDIAALYYLVQYRAFEFAIGGSLAYLFSRNILSVKQGVVSEIFCLLGFIFILYPVFKYDENTLFPSYNALMPAVGAAFLIYAGSAKFTGYILRNRVVGFIGLISYSLYLIHWPLIVFVKTYNEDMGQAFEISLTTKLIILFGSILIATFMYYFIEQPFRKGIPKEKIKQIFLLTRWSVIIVIFVALGCSIFYSKGWLWRANSPNALKNVSDISKYHAENWGGAGFSGGLIYEGKTKYPNIVMMGDSHSGMLDTGMIKEIARPTNKTVFQTYGTYTSSLLLPGMIRLVGDKNALEKAAKAWIDVVNQINQSKDSILVYSSWIPGQLNVSGDFKTGKSFDMNTEKMTEYYQYDALTSSFDKLLAKLGNHKFIIVGDVPGSLSYNPTECLSKLKWFISDNCSSKDRYNQNKAALNVNKVLKEYASKHENVYFINPYDIFCKDGYCLNVDKDGTPFYSDSVYRAPMRLTNSHLSKTGSIYFISHIKDQLMDIINQPIATKQ